MPDLVDRMGAALLDASLAATAIAALVVLAMVQSRQPARRLGWARAGLLATLALLPLAALNPVPRIDLRGYLRALFPSHYNGPDPPPGRRPVKIEARRDMPDLGDLDHESLACPHEEFGPAPGPWWVRWVARGMVLAYGSGASIGLGGIILGLWGSAWLVRRASMPSDLSLGHYASLPFEGETARPRLLISARVGRPVLLGITRPVILIPPDLDDPEAVDQLRLGLLHEMAHAASGDHRYAPFAMLAQAIWFFLPPVWWIRDQMKLDQEFLADRRAVAHFGRSCRYASSLVDLAAVRTTKNEGQVIAATAPTKGMTSALFQRVLMLLRCPFAIEGQTPLWWRWSTAATLGLITVAASCLTLRGLAGSFGTIEPSGSSAVARSFRLPQLVIALREQDDQPFDLRFRLPDQFTLTLEVMAEPADLPALEILGHKLCPAPQIDSSRQVYRLWHRVQIHRVNGLEDVRVDDHPIAGPFVPVKLAPWLSIRPLPGKTTRIRDLELSW